MTTTNTHAAPWTIRRFLADMILKPTPNLLQTKSGTWSNPAILTGREAVARHLCGEACHWSALGMLEYDTSHYLRGAWLAEADRRIAQPDLDLPELLVARWHGYTPAEWLALPALVQVDKREGYFQARGLGA